MEIRKRNGESVPFQQEKIFNAMKKAFDGQGIIEETRLNASNV